jgi:phospholipase C
VCGDLTSVFDFATPNASVAALPDTSGYIAAADATRALPRPVVPSAAIAAAQEQGQRPARALPYAFDVTCEIDAQRKAIALNIINTGAVGVALNAYAAGGAAGPWFFTVEAGKSLRHEVVTRVDAYDLMIYGPNGFLRHFRGQTQPTEEPVLRFEANAGHVLAQGRHRISHRAYVPEQAELVLPNTGPVGNLPAITQETWSLAGSDHWYDLEITKPDDPTFLRRFAGHIETGAPSLSDPLLGANRT